VEEETGFDVFKVRAAGDFNLLSMFAPPMQNIGLIISSGKKLVSFDPWVISP
jgi:hypothetical protein